MHSDLLANYCVLLIDLLSFPPTMHQIHISKRAKVTYQFCSHQNPNKINIAINCCIYRMPQTTTANSQLIAAFNSSSATFKNL